MSSTAAGLAAISQLVEAGVGDLVLSPGSRSAPLAFAAKAAADAGRLRLHVRVDERSAGYLALGLAKVSRRPVALVCTSGTAVANLLPAVVEASYSGLPLVLLTADRPAQLREVGANQTIDQAGIFGNNVRHAVDVPSLAGLDPHAVDELIRATVSAAVTAAADQCTGGPVHVNVGFAEPLVPGLPSPMAGRPSARTPPARAARITAPGTPIDSILAQLVDGSQSAARDWPAGPSGRDGSPVPARGVVLVGDVPSAEWVVDAVNVAQACGWPILSEPSGNAGTSPNSIAHFALLLGSDRFRESHVPDLVLSVGRFGISRPTLELIRSARLHIAVATPGRDRPDPVRSAVQILDAVPIPPAGRTAGDPAWLAEWREASAAAGAALSALDSGRSPEPSRPASDHRPLSGPEVARLVVGACGGSDLLVLASSRAVRDVQDYAATGPTRPWIIGNRGASGIDGLVSTAWGAALAHPGHTVALMGDLAFLHDSNGLLAPTAEPCPDLTIVVADNNGGGIFSSLEQGDARFATDFETIFGTPQDRDLAAIARAFGVDTVSVTTGEELSRELEVHGTGAVRVIVAKLMERRAEADARAAIATAIASEVQARQAR